MEKLHTFYAKLYENRNNQNASHWISNLRNKGLIPQLPEEDGQILEALILKEELKQNLKKCADNKSPGNDGLTKEFYTYF